MDTKKKIKLIEFYFGIILILLSFLAFAFNGASIRLIVNDNSVIGPINENILNFEFSTIIFGDQQYLGASIPLVIAFILVLIGILFIPLTFFIRNIKYLSSLLMIIGGIIFIFSANLIAPTSTLNYLLTNNPTNYNFVLSSDVGVYIFSCFLIAGSIFLIFGENLKFKISFEK